MQRLVWLLAIIIVGGGAGAQSLPPWGPPFSLEKSAAYQCVRARTPVVVDGQLNDAIWAQAQRIEHFLVPPKMDWINFAVTRPYPARSLTRAWLAWDDHYLYFAAEMEDRDLYGVTPKSHDAPFGADDIIELFLKPHDSQPGYWELHIMPSGATRDYYFARRGAGSDRRFIKYDTGMQAAVSLSGTLDHWEDRDNEWMAEMRVPWTAFARAGGKPQIGDYWRFLVSRYDYSVYLEEGVELSAAAPLPWQSYHLFEYYPYLVFKE